MSYETLIATLLQEGETKCKAGLRKARAEADQVFAAANEFIARLEREADLRVQQEIAERQTAILAKARLSARHLVLQAKHEALEALWQRASEKLLRLRGIERQVFLQALLLELVASAPSGQLKAVIDEREHPDLEGYLKERGIPYEVQHRDDLVLGAEVEVNGEILRSSLPTRLTKAKPELMAELNQMLFADSDQETRDVREKRERQNP